MSASTSYRSLATYLAIAATMFQFGLGQAFAVEHGEEIRARKTQEINKGRVGIISGSVTGTYIQIASDLANVLDKGNELRIIAMLGKGSVQNIEDILYLKGVDIGIVQSDVLTHLVRTRKHPNITRRIHYITKLYNEEFHLLAGKNIKSIDDLAGKKVNFGKSGSGTEMTAKILFDSVGISVTGTNYDQKVALEKMAKGELGAAVYVVGKPASVFTKEAENIGQYAHFIPLNYTPKLLQVYIPTKLDHSDYPKLIPAGQTVRTVAVGAILAVYNWPAGHARYDKVKRFVDAFIDNIAEFKKQPRHKKWKEVDLSVEVPGWDRYAPATARLRTSGVLSSTKSLSAEEARLEKLFEGYLRSQNLENIGAQQKKELFQGFLNYMEQQN